jgi:hypothetical protein
MQREQMAERVYRQMEFRAALAFGTVVAGPRTAFGRRAQGPAVNNGGGRFGRAAGGEPQHRTQILSQRLETARGQPT